MQIDNKSGTRRKSTLSEGLLHLLSFARAEPGIDAIGLHGRYQG
jgi:hypothetical protein